MSWKHGFRVVTTRQGATSTINVQVIQSPVSGYCFWRVNARPAGTTTSTASTPRLLHSRRVHTIDHGRTSRKPQRASTGTQKLLLESGPCALPGTSARLDLSCNLTAPLIPLCPKSSRSYSTLSSNGPSIPDQARHLMRSVPHPVAIVTSSGSSSSTSTAKRKASVTDDDRQLRGATISSFNTVSLSPTAVISFNVTSFSSTFEAIKQSGQFVVSLLAATPEATELASQFAGVVSHESGRKGPDIGSLPAVAGTDDGDHSNIAVALFAFTCRYLPDKTVAINDHVVVFGEVERLWTPPEQSIDDSSKDALIYADGMYKMAHNLE